MFLCLCFTSANMSFGQTRHKLCSKTLSLQVIAFIDLSAHTAISCGTSIARGCVLLKAVASLPLASTSLKLWQKGERDKHRQAGIPGKTSNKAGTQCTNVMKFNRKLTEERREGIEGGMAEVVTWLPGLPGWHRWGSEGWVWDKEVEKQSRGIRNYRDRQRHSEAVIAHSNWHIWCANDSVPITLGH